MEEIRIGLGWGEDGGLVGIRGELRGFLQFLNLHFGEENAEELSFVVPFGSIVCARLVWLRVCRLWVWVCVFCDCCLLLYCCTQSGG